MDQNSSQSQELPHAIQIIKAGAAERKTEFELHGYNDPYWTTSTSTSTSDGTKEFEVQFPLGRSFEKCVWMHLRKSTTQLGRYANTGLRVGYLRRSRRYYLVVYNPKPPASSHPTRRKDALSLGYGLLWGALRAYCAQLEADDQDIRIDDFFKSYFDELWGLTFDERVKFDQRFIRDYEERKQRERNRQPEESRSGEEKSEEVVDNQQPEESHSEEGRSGEVVGNQQPKQNSPETTVKNDGEERR